MMKAVAVVALVLTMAPSLGLAEEASGTLAEVQSLLERAEYRRALSSVRSVIESGGLTPAQLAEAYNALAVCSAALRRRDESRQAFIRLLAIEPDFTLPAQASPLLRRPFRQASSFWEDEQPPRLTYDPPDQLVRVDVLSVEPQFDPGPLPDFITDLTLHLRQPSGEFMTYIGVDGRIDIAPSEFANLDELEIYLALNDEYGNAVITVGSPDDPLRVPLQDTEPVEQAETIEPAVPTTAPPASGPPWYRRWWVWTLVGLVVAGLSVGLPLGLLDLDQDICDRNLGSSCDYEGILIR